MLLRDEGGGVDIAAKPDLRSACIALQQKRFSATAAGGQNAGQNREYYRPCWHAGDLTSLPTIGQFGERQPIATPRRRRSVFRSAGQGATVKAGLTRSARRCLGEAHRLIDGETEHGNGGENNCHGPYREGRRSLRHNQNGSRRSDRGLITAALRAGRYVVACILLPILRSPLERASPPFMPMPAIPGVNGWHFELVSQGRLWPQNRARARYSRGNAHSSAPPATAAPRLRAASPRRATATASSIDFASYIAQRCPQSARAALRARE